MSDKPMPDPKLLTEIIEFCRKRIPEAEQISLPGGQLLAYHLRMARRCANELLVVTRERATTND